MKKSLVVFMTTGLVLTAASTAYALTEANVTNPTPDKGNIVSNTYTPMGIDTNGDGVYDSKDFHYFEDSTSVGGVQADNGDSIHVYGTWNSPYTDGIDGYNYNDAQDYVSSGDQVDTTSPTGPRFQSGPHGGYLTSTHRCRECHAVHRAAGKFKLMRSDTRFEACDWCHGTGAGSGFNIQMDNNDDYTTEYNVGHTMGFGIDSGKWRAPDDTYPAFAPNYYMGGFSCFDCHSPHANPQRLLGFNNAGVAVGVTSNATSDHLGKKYGIANPGHGDVTDGAADHVPGDPVYLAGSWLLIKDPDREVADEDTDVPGGIYANATAANPETTSVSIVTGQEIPDYITADITKWADGNYYPVNKLPTDWDSPVGPAGSPNGPYAPDSSTTVAGPRAGYTVRFMNKRIWNVSEFCTDCHDGNAGLHTVGAPLYSEDRALRGQGDNLNTTDLTDTAYNWKGNYDVAYGHDAQPRH